MQNQQEVHLQSDPIFGGLGILNDGDKEPMSVDEAVEKDLESRRPLSLKPILSEEVSEVDEDIHWAEEQLGKKLKPYVPKTPSEKYDPADAPEYPDPHSMDEDEDTASTLKSAHLAEWIHGLSQSDHHHHDPFYIDEHGKRHYNLNHGGYEGPGHSHYGRNQ